MSGKRILLLISIAIAAIQSICSQVIDSSSFKLTSRYSFYSYEKKGEMLLHIPDMLLWKNLRIVIKINETVINSWEGRPAKNILRLPFSIDMPPSQYKSVAEIVLVAETGVKYVASTFLSVLKYKPNEVKTDRLTGGLSVNRKQFIPFGFYCYSPVYTTLPEEETVKGFNVISPYQKILSETLSERKAYMDRCAQLGMKVNYNLLSVSGGGGVGSKTEGFSEEKKRELLIEEIRTFMDHPALLAWYIADEPTGNKVSPQTLENIYRLVKENDPWHPVSVVFMAPFISARDFSSALDIVMADPYPVPDLPVSMVGKVSGQLRKEFEGKKPVWIVPQAFGGGELWQREPTLQEIRSMTYQSIIKGATGIQYFVRQGLNAFPKSISTWGECGRMAVEIGELTPWLLSDEETFQAESGSPSILVTTKCHQGQMIVMVVNTVNKPMHAEIKLSGIANAPAKVVFENRSVNIEAGFLYDIVPPFGSQVYMVNIKPEAESVRPYSGNLIKDSGFEDISTPGLPVYCYAQTGKDRGSTYFLDSKEHFEGKHSLRLITPSDNGSITLKFFPFMVEAGKSYMISVMAKTDPEQRFTDQSHFSGNLKADSAIMPQYVEVELGNFGKSRFVPDSDWKQFVTFVTIKSDTLPSFKTNLILRMPGSGVAWFDMLQVIKDPLQDTR